MPAPDVFPEAGADNTFADGVAPELARLYAQAYASVYKLLASRERARIEERHRAAAVAAAVRKIAAEAKHAKKRRRAFNLALARQLELRALNARRLYPVLVSSASLVPRLTAYYALVCMEMYAGDVPSPEPWLTCGAGTCSCSP